MSAASLKRLGLNVSKEAPKVTLEKRTLRTPEGSLTIDVPEGIGTGWAYNPGEGVAGWGAQMRALREAEGGAPKALEVPGIDIRKAALPELPVLAARALQGPAIKPASEERLLDLFRATMGGETTTLTDPLGLRVGITRAIPDHILEGPAIGETGARWGREIYWPFIRETVEAPQEIWIGFARFADGRIKLRRRYIRLVDTGKAKGRSFYLIADEQDGFWVSFNFMANRRGRNVDALRTGALIYRK